jgi:hypothetical protein
MLNPISGVIVVVRLPTRFLAPVWRFRVCGVGSAGCQNVVSCARLVLRRGVVGAAWALRSVLEPFWNRSGTIFVQLWGRTPAAR